MTVIAAPNHKTNPPATPADGVAAPADREYPADWDAVVAGALLCRVLGVDPSTLSRWKSAGLAADEALTLLVVARWLVGQRRPAAGRVPGAALGDDVPPPKSLSDVELAEKIEKLRLQNAKTRGDLIPRAALAELADRWAMAGAILSGRLEAIARSHGPGAVESFNNALAEAEREIRKSVDAAEAAADAGRFTESADGPPAETASPRKSRGGRPSKGTA